MTTSGSTPDIAPPPVIDPAAGVFPPSYPDEWRIVPEQRILTTLTPDPPRQEDWPHGEPCTGSADAFARVPQMAADHYAAGRLVWVWAGHNGPYTPGLWKSYYCVGPPGWMSEEDIRESERVRARKSAEDAKRIEAARHREEQARLRKEGKLSARIDATDSIVTQVAARARITRAPAVELVPGDVPLGVPDPDLEDGEEPPF